MPNTGAQQFDDAYPQAQGGVRAFFKSTSLTTSGLVAPTQEVCTGLCVVSGYSARSGGGGGATGTVRYMTTWDNTAGKTRIYRMDGTGGQTTWTVLFTSAATADNAARRRHSSFAKFETTAGVDYMMVVLRSSVDFGLYSILYDPTAATSGAGSDGTVTKINTHDGALATTQGRVVVGSNDTATDQTFYWSDVGAITFSGATSGSLTPTPNISRNAVCIIAPFDPDQILLGFSSAPWVTITGDINSATTPVRQMGDGHYPQILQDPIRTPDGIVFIESHGSAYVTDGRAFTDITPQLSPFSGAQPPNVNTLGVGAFHEGFLFLPGGQVRFEESKGWFHTGDQDGIIYQADPVNGVISASAGVSFTLREREVSRALGTRASSYTWRSAPFAQPDGTQTEIREVAIQGECYGASTYTITLTDHLGNTEVLSAVAAATGKHVIHTPTLLRGDYCDVKIVAANNGSGEAPTIERVRIGFGMGHSL